VRTSAIIAVAKIPPGISSLHPYQHASWSFAHMGNDMASDSSAVCKLEEQGMPTYEFQCVKCRKRFELAYSVTEYERRAKKIKCPKCGSTRVGRQISAFEVKTSKKS
jgi:putative FmdB family regulatory protein